MLRLGHGPPRNPRPTTLSLSRHELIDEAVVVVREDTPGEQQLVAYVTRCEKARPGSPPPAQILRAYLAEALPEYMVPGAFVVLERLPLMPNGKVDKKALPAPVDSYVKRPYGSENEKVEELLPRLRRALLAH